jgi:simple sugar transport system ATP-binding protein
MTGDTTSGRQATASPLPPAIELRGISKAFGPVQANKDISILVRPGTIHGIIGENGAGKSTLMSILYGFYKADSGEIFINGTPVQIPDSQSAIRAGIGMVFQHFKLVQNFTVLENVVLGAEDGRLLRPSLAACKRLAARKRSSCRATRSGCRGWASLSCGSGAEARRWPRTVA